MTWLNWGWHKPESNIYDVYGFIQTDESGSLVSRQMNIAPQCIVIEHLECAIPTEIEFNMLVGNEDVTLENTTDNTPKRQTIYLSYGCQKAILPID